MAFNSILYLILSICTGLLIIGSFFPPLLICGCIGHMFGGCAILACVIVTGVFRYTGDGKDCAKSELTLFKDHSELIQNLFIAQCVCMCFYNCCAGFIMQMSMMAGVLGTASFFAKRGY